MDKIINLDQWKQRKLKEEKELEQIQNMINKVRTPNFTAMWVGVVILAFLPWAIFFLTIGLFTEVTEQTKLLGAVIATMFSPLLVITAAQIVFNETKRIYKK